MHTPEDGERGGRNQPRGEKGGRQDALHAPSRFAQDGRHHKDVEPRIERPAERSAQRKSRAGEIPSPIKKYKKEQKRDEERIQKRDAAHPFRENCGAYGEPQERDEGRKRGKEAIEPRKHGRGRHEREERKSRTDGGRGPLEQGVHCPAIAAVFLPEKEEDGGEETEEKRGKKDGYKVLCRRKKTNEFRARDKSRADRSPHKK